MEGKTYQRLLFALVAVCLALTVAHFAYVVYAYQHASIIYFIGEELWNAG